MGWVARSGARLSSGYSLTRECGLELHQLLCGKTITVYSSLNAFNRSLGIDGQLEICVALVDPDGTVHSLIKGDVTEAKVDQLRAAYP